MGGVAGEEREVKLGQLSEFLCAVFEDIKLPNVLLERRPMHVGFNGFKRPLNLRQKIA